ncbi:VOC family protein [Streptomyces griseoluteus]|uniref:VOC family protein n=1 Tax=Streptomyces griseoluteus TaxID=29306 RepID=UPI0036997917
MARFWGEAWGRTVHRSTDDLVLLRSADGTGPYMELFRSPTGGHGTRPRPPRPAPPPRRRPGGGGHRLKALGASGLDIDQGDVPWTCLTDPEGHEFCVLALP